MTPIADRKDDFRRRASEARARAREAITAEQCRDALVESELWQRLAADLEFAPVRALFQTRRGRFHSLADDLSR